MHLSNAWHSLTDLELVFILDSQDDSTTQHVKLVLADDAPEQWESDRPVKHFVCPLAPRGSVEEETSWSSRGSPWQDLPFDVRTGSSSSATCSSTLRDTGKTRGARGYKCRVPPLHPSAVFGEPHWELRCGWQTDFMWRMGRVEIFPLTVDKVREAWRPLQT